MNRKTFVGMFLLAGIFFSCENDMATIKKITSKEAAQTETGTDIEALYSNQGKIQARLVAPIMKHFEVKEPYTELPDGFNIYFYDDSMIVNSQMKAGYGIAYDKSDNMIARNNVEVINIMGEKLNTEELLWNQKTQRISSDKFVKITTKDEIIFGDGFESNQDLSNYSIKKIRGTIQVKDEDI